MGLLGVMWVLVATGRLLDLIFYPAVRQQPVIAPIFIVAPPRSGTTFLQKLMSLDEQFVHSKLYQTIFPSVIYQEMLQGIVQLDRIIGAPGRRIIEWAEKRWFGGWDEMHKMRFDQPEEDDGFFVYTFVTEAIFLLFPYVNELWAAGFQDALPRERRKRLMAYYRQCLQRQLYANGRDKTILSKATQSSGSVRCLLEEFPDARFITIVRHPYESVPSHVSVFYPVWQAHSPEIARDSEVSRAYAKLAVEWYRHLHLMGKTVRSEQFYCVDYRQMMQDAVGTVTGIYKHYGLTMSDAFSAKLRLSAQRERGFKSKHHYTLEEFGLSKEWIQSELGELLDAHSLAR